MNPKISVIVPVYNTEKYLHRCIDSILAQTFTDFEVLLIDDGSTDSSGTICDEYAHKDSRVRVFHKENGGVGAARKMGIDNAFGKYSIHVDSDDWIECNMLEELYKKACDTQADMVICDFYEVNRIKKIYRKQNISAPLAHTTLEDLLFNRIHGSLCNKLIKLSCYKEFGVDFIRGVDYCEDYLVNVQLLSKDISVAYLGMAFYNYDQYTSNKSITRMYTIETYKQRCNFLSELKILLGCKNENAILKNEAYVAIESLYHDILSSRQFWQKYGTKLISLIRHVAGKRNKIFFFLSACGLKRLGRKMLF